ncbi:hypothetical protein [Schnuerera sp.]|uniref:hypothetical protein n=1 Tax=Schnuerera sp. TaxID=2794844 RepID=UPI002CB96E88|nr:hypothetical protein [Schnuerera sp.]HSH34999.1 hypothetical protein [Schnuerera sp.]
MMIVVIVVVALVINWRLGGLFAKDATDTTFNDPPNKINRDNVLDSDDERNYENQDDQSQDINSEPEEDTDKSSNDNLTEEDTAVIVKVSIPAGSLPPKIGDILVANDLIEDKNEFIEKAVELKLETKLKSGEFEISKNSSLEEILKILTN